MRGEIEACSSGASTDEGDGKFPCTAALLACNPSSASVAAGGGMTGRVGRSVCEGKGAVNASTLPASDATPPAGDPRRSSRRSREWSSRWEATCASCRAAASRKPPGWPIAA